MVKQVRVRVSINSGAVRNELQGNGKGADKYLRRVAREVEGVAKATAPQGYTGKLRQSITATPVRHGPRRSLIDVKCDKTIAPHALWVILGTGRHGPKGQAYGPVTASRMAFPPYKGRRYNFPISRKTGLYLAKEVQGQQPNDFLTRALDLVDAARPELKQRPVNIRSGIRPGL